MESKLKLAIKAIEIAIIRLEEIRYQKASDKQLEFLKEVLKKIKENNI